MRRLLPLTAAAAIALITSGCGSGGSGSETVTLPLRNDNNPAATYSGPAPRDGDVQDFKIAVWDQLAADDRCGSCHSLEGNQAPLFVRRDDINLAYEAVLGIVDRNNPGASLLKTRVGDGHNCWLSDDTACADIIDGYLGNWLGSSAQQAERIALNVPPLKDPGASKNFPQSNALFAGGGVYSASVRYCAECHAEGAESPQAPYFASDDIDIAYAASRSKIDLNKPSASRLVVRLREEFHNCWSDCAQNAQQFEDAIAAMAAQIPLSAINPDWIVSKALQLADGTVSNSQGRVDNNLIARWQFKTGSGNIAFDTSGLSPAADLQISGNVEWLAGWGLRITNGKAQASTAGSRKIHEQISSSGEFSIEAWVAPANVTQEGPAMMLSYAGSASERNFGLGQTLYNYNFLMRHQNSDASGNPALSTADADQILQASLQHVVASFHPVDGQRIYVNGELVASNDESTVLEAWDDSFALAIGNEVSNDRPWQGSIRFLAIHRRALDAEAINTNFDAGVGQSFYLPFSIAHLSGQEDQYLVFKVSLFDNHAYLFHEPIFTSIQGNTTASNIDTRGLRIGVNGKHPENGQAYKRLTMQLSDSNGQTLSSIGTVIPVENGSELDEFFLSWEGFGERSYEFEEAAAAAAAPADDSIEQADIGLRTFDEINASMAAITGVGRADPAIANLYAEIRQQLPSITDIETYNSSQQMAMTQLAIQYCDALLENRGSISREEFFGNELNFTSSQSNLAGISEASWRTGLINPLLDRTLGQSLSSQPEREPVTAELLQLIDTLSTCDGACPDNRIRTIAKASCAASLGSALTLLQ